MKTQCVERGGRRLYRRPLHITVEKSTHHSYDILTEESTSVIEDGTLRRLGYLTSASFPRSLQMEIIYH